MQYGSESMCYWALLASHQSQLSSPLLGSGTIIIGHRGAGSCQGRFESMVDPDVLFNVFVVDSIHPSLECQ